MNAVSTREASGSAARASDAGTAMRSTSDPSSSSLKTLLRRSFQLDQTSVHKHGRIEIGEPAKEMQIKLDSVIARKRTGCS
jgi:hypothetical protein